MTSAPRARILVVDDNATLRAVFRATLAQAGFADVEEAPCGREALQRIAEKAFSVVLLDNQMPGMNGLDVLHHLRSRAETATVPVILITGQAEVTDRVRGLDAGANDYLTKPVDFDELVARVHAQIRVRDAWTSVVDAGARRRAALVEVMSRIRPSENLAETASAICEELSGYPGLSGAAVLALRGRGLVTALAVSGSLEGAVVPGRPIHASVAASLADRAAVGPWIDAVEATHRPRDTRWRSDHGSTVYVPLGSPERRLGLLVLRVTTAGGATDHATEALSVAIDVAGIVTALLGPRLEERAELERSAEAIHEVLATNAYSTVFQPVIDLRDGAPVGFEALARFADGTRPDVRLAEAARAGIAIEVEGALVAAALERATALPAGAWLSLNVSPAMVCRDGGLGRILQGRGPRRVVLEVTEHEPVDDYEELRAAFRRLGPGIELAVDDAGAGYASLRHVLALQPSFVKLDREWVSALDTDRARQALVSGLALFASQSGCQLIAEGVETEPERDTVKGLGIDLAQGYLFGRPAPAPERRSP